MFVLKRKKVKFFLLLLFCPFILSAQNMNVYLIPGQGADHRLFNELDLGDGYEIHHVSFRVGPIFQSKKILYQLTHNLF